MRRRRILAVVTALAVVAGAGCGDDSSDSDEVRAAFVAAVDAAAIGDVDGWDVSEPAPAGGGDGMTVVANDGNVVVQISVYTQVGVNNAPQGTVLAQIRAAAADADLAWTS